MSLSIPVEKSHQSLRRLLIQHRQFFWDLTQKNPVWCKRRLHRASPLELRTLIRFLVCLEKGHVEIRAENYRALVRSKRVNTLIGLRKKKNYYLKCSSEEKIQILSQFASVFRHLLEPLFFERKIKLVTTYFTGWIPLLKFYWTKKNMSVSVR